MDEDNSLNTKLSYKNNIYPLCGAGNIHYSIKENGDLMYCNCLNDDIFKIGTYFDLPSRINYLDNTFEDKVNKIVSLIHNNCFACPIIEEKMQQKDKENVM